MPFQYLRLSLLKRLLSVVTGRSCFSQRIAMSFRGVSPPLGRRKRLLFTVGSSADRTICSPCKPIARRHGRRRPASRRCSAEAVKVRPRRVDLMPRQTCFAEMELCFVCQTGIGDRFIGSWRDFVSWAWRQVFKLWQMVNVQTFDLAIKSFFFTFLYEEKCCCVNSFLGQFFLRTTWQYKCKNWQTRACS